jgi:NADH-quinone oxidoreductase subunit N
MYANLDTVRILWPEVILVLMASWIYLGGSMQSSRGWWAVFALAAYAMAAYVIGWKEGAYWSGADAEPFLTGPILFDYLGYSFRCFILLIGALFTMIAARYAHRSLASEFIATLMLLIVGLMLVARANDLVLMFVGLELVSIPTYVLLYLGRRDRATAEAATKYFFLSILSSALLLYGLSFLYGIAGTTTLVGGPGVPSILASVLQPNMPTQGLVPLAFVLVFSGLGFKIAAVPFHFYAPDVYQGANHLNAGLLAVAPKFAGILALVRILVVAMPHAADLAWQLSMLVALLTMTLGNVCALWQQNLRRMMAYSSIAHAGYLLIGIAAGFWGAAHGTNVGGVSAVLVYLSVYALASLGTFASLAVLSEEDRDVNGIDSLAGLGRARPVVATSLAICMFSLAGIPPLAGFWGKLFLFGSSLQAALATENSTVAGWFVVLAIVGALNAAIAAAYYLRVVSVMFFRSAEADLPRSAGVGPAAAMVICAVLLLAIGISPRQTIQASKLAETGLPVFDVMQANVDGDSETFARRTESTEEATHYTQYPAH